MAVGEITKLLFACTLAVSNTHYHMYSFILNETAENIFNLMTYSSKSTNKRLTFAYIIKLVL